MAEVSKDLCAHWQGSGAAGVFLERESALSGEHQHGPRPHGGSCGEVAVGVPDQGHILKPMAHTCGNVLEQARSGFSAAAAGIGAMRTEEDGLDLPTSLCQAFAHLLVNAVELREMEEATREARLVGDHKDTPALVIEPTNGLKTADNRLPFLWALDVAIGVKVDHAIPVEDDHRPVWLAEAIGHVASRERSAT
jgi:hypothetical protein